MTWDTTTSPVAALDATFDGMDRARRRVTDVEEIGRDSWLVHGSASLGDAYSSYNVDIADGRYTCSCYSHGNGSIRRAKVCSHVKAVILWRRQRKVIAQARQRLTSARDGVRPVPQERGVGEVDGVAAPTTPSGDRSLSVVESAVPSTDSLPDLSDPSWGEPGWPDWLTSLRPHQVTAIADVMAAYERGAKVVFLVAPTGSGKTVIGEAVGRLLGGTRAYVCTTKALQAQFLRDYPYARILMGRSNYATLGGVENVNLWGEKVSAADKHAKSVTCADCTWTRSSGCKWCHDRALCPYNVAKMDAVTAPLAVLNTSYFLTDANKGSQMFAARDLVVMDEADLLEGELMNQVEVRISKTRQRALNLDPPTRKTVQESWVEWTPTAIARVEARLATLPPPSSPDAKISQVREHKGLTQLLDSLLLLQQELPSGGWVYDGYNDGDIVFKPIRVAKWGHMIWSHGERFLLMSATIISAQQMADDLGLTDEYAVVDVPSTFPPANRPINVCAVATMSRKSEDTAIPKMVTAIGNILALHPDDRILVHTVSYKLADRISGDLRALFNDRPIVTYAKSWHKQAALDQYLTTPAAVLVAASMDRGIDLPDDACRVQVVAKLPYPNLGDKQVSARLHSAGGDGWYKVATVRSLVQSTGRGIRSETDHAVTYLLDHSFTQNLWRQSQHLLPAWWKDGLRWDFDVRRLLEPLR